MEDHDWGSGVKLKSRDIMHEVYSSLPVYQTCVYLCIMYIYIYIDMHERIGIRHSHRLHTDADLISSISFLNNSVILCGCATSTGYWIWIDVPT